MAVSIKVNQAFSLRLLGLKYLQHMEQVWLTINNKALWSLPRSWVLPGRHLS